MTALRKPSTRSKEVLFVGAGASRSAGLPLLHELFASVAEFARAGYRSRATSAQTRLAEYLHLVHGLTEARLAAMAKNKVTDADVSEAHQREMAVSKLNDILTTLDVAIADGTGFGRLPRRGPSGERRDFSGGRLHRVRNSIVNAFSEALQDARRASDRTTRSQSIKTIRTLTDRFRDGVIVTTNWDTLLDRALWGTAQLSYDQRARWKPERRVNYTPIAQEIVDHAGARINDKLADLECIALLKLHGSMNWLACPRCRRLIVNPVVDLLGRGRGGKNWVDQTCWCEADAEALLVTPSYAKSYSNLHLQAIWREALQGLAEADRWVFVGFSIPSDDAWIRALLTRALAWKRAARSPKLEVVVVGKSDEADRAQRAARGKARPTKSVSDFVAMIDRYRSVLGDFGATPQIVPWACGLEEWVDCGMPVSIPGGK